MKTYRAAGGALAGGASLAEHFAAAGLDDAVFIVDVAAGTVTVENADDVDTVRRDAIQSAVQSFTGAPPPRKRGRDDVMRDALGKATTVEDLRAALLTWVGPSQPPPTPPPAPGPSPR